jgi:phosphoenolpyruvate carboxylase
MDEFDRTAAMLNLVFGGRRLKERRPRMVKTLRLREARLRVLHHRQIELLRRWRPLKAAEDEAAHALLPQLLLSVNAIASGLRTTG